MMVQVYVELTL